MPTTDEEKATLVYKNNSSKAIKDHMFSTSTQILRQWRSNLPQRWTVEIHQHQLVRIEKKRFRELEIITPLFNHQ